jgi:hypothetical protein
MSFLCHGACLASRSEYLEFVVVLTASLPFALFMTPGLPLSTLQLLGSLEFAMTDDLTRQLFINATLLQQRRYLGSRPAIHIIPSPHEDHSSTP